MGTTIGLHGGTGTTATIQANGVDVVTIDSTGIIGGVVGKAASGANSDITSLTALSTALSVAQGGTGQITAALAFGALKQAATDAATGVVELATDAEAMAGTDATRTVTPANLASTKSLAADGYMKFPGGLILQWGRFNPNATPDAVVSITFAMAFPVNCVAVALATTYGSATGVTTVVDNSGLSASGFDARCSVNTGDYIYYLAVGY